MRYYCFCFNAFYLFSILLVWFGFDRGGSYLQKRKLLEHLINTRIVVNDEHFRRPRFLSYLSFGKRLIFSSIISNISASDIRSFIPHSISLKASIEALPI